jgi:hypothetical protein
MKNALIAAATYAAIEYVQKSKPNREKSSKKDKRSERERQRQEKYSRQGR